MSSSMFSLVLEEEDAARQHDDAVRAQLLDERLHVDALVLGVDVALGLDADPQEEDAQPLQQLDAVLVDGLGRAEQAEAPLLAVLLHQREQLEGALAVLEEVLVEDEELIGAHRRLEPAAGVEDLAPGAQVRDVLALEKMRRAAKVAAVRAAVARHEHRRGAAGRGAQEVAIESRLDLRMANRCLVRLAEQAAHEADALAAADRVAGDEPLDLGDRADLARPAPEGRRCAAAARARAPGAPCAAPS